MPTTDTSKKSILYVITRAGRGGAQAHVASLCRQATQSGFKVTLASGDGEGWLVDQARDIGASTRVIKNLKRSWNPLKGFALVLEAYLLLRGGKYDIVHLHSSNSLLVAWGARLAGGSKVFFTLHGWSILHPGWQKSGLLKTTYSLALRLLLPSAHKVLFVSAADRDFGIKNKLVTAEASAVIHNGIDENMELMTRCESRSRLGIRENEFVVATIARFDYPKNLELLVEAALLLTGDDYKVLLIGDGPDKPALQEFLATCGPQDKIAIIDDLSKPVSHLRGFDCFVLCSRFEGLPYSLLEAGLASVPIVATPVGGVPEIVDRGQTGRLVMNSDPETLAKEIAWVHDNPEESQRQAAAMTAKIKSSFTESVMAAKVFAEYNKPLSDR